MKGRKLVAVGLLIAFAFAAGVTALAGSNLERALKEAQKVVDKANAEIAKAVYKAQKEAEGKDSASVDKIIANLLKQVDSIKSQAVAAIKEIEKKYNVWIKLGFTDWWVNIGGKLVNVDPITIAGSGCGADGC